MTEKLDSVVVGAGVIGLAIGRSLALAGRDVVVLESEAQIGMHSSSRNSEVIHAGLYYPEDSLKARLCVQGRDMLYAYCEEHNVGHRRLGKLIVAAGRRSHELNRLTEIKAQAEKNGVADLQYLSVDEVHDLEPEVVRGGGIVVAVDGHC